MRILITGAKGQLGRAVTERLVGEDLIQTDLDNLDITNFNETAEFLKKINPEIIINCAAYTAVDLCETEIDTAYRVNALGPRNLAIVAAEIGCEMVHISTDYVFDGNGIVDELGRIRPYCEFDEANPQTIYGKSKLEGEKFVRAFCPNSYIIRTAWLYGDGHNFVKTMLKLSRENKEISVVNDQWGTPTSAAEVAGFIFALIRTKQYGLYHGTCEGACSWYEFALEIFRLKELDMKVIPITTDLFPRPAKRPKYSVLDNYIIRLVEIYEFKDWKSALAEYLRDN